MADSHQEQVRKLRAVAASTSFPEEAATARRIADSIEAKYGRPASHAAPSSASTPRPTTRRPAKRTARRARKPAPAGERAVPKVKPERLLPVDPAAIGRLLRKRGFGKSRAVRAGSVLVTEGYVAWTIHGMGGPKAKHLAVAWRVPDGDQARADARLAEMLAVLAERWHAEIVEIGGTRQILVRAGKAKR